MHSTIKKKVLLTRMQSMKIMVNTNRKNVSHLYEIPLADTGQSTTNVLNNQMCTYQGHVCV